MTAAALVAAGLAADLGLAVLVGRWLRRRRRALEATTQPTTNNGEQP